MIEPEVKENQVEVSFCFKGFNSSSSYEKQVPQTSPLVRNCRLRDVVDNRARGGQRPGLKKTSSTQVGTSVPVQVMVQVTTTYVPADEPSAPTGYAIDGTLTPGT